MASGWRCWEGDRTVNDLPGLASEVADGRAGGTRDRGQELSAVPAGRDPQVRRAGRGLAAGQGHVRRRGAWVLGERAGSAVRRTGRQAGGRAAAWDWAKARGRVHHERAEVPAAE